MKVILASSQDGKREFDARLLAQLTAELHYAWNRSDRELLGRWTRQSAGIFGKSITRRVKNVGGLLSSLAVGTVSEVKAAREAIHRGEFGDHARMRGGSLIDKATRVGLNVKDAAQVMVAAVRNDPREKVPQLLTIVLVSLIVSGGPDADGGAPDLDLLAGIGAHRSIFTHSIVMGSALETAVLSLANLVSLLHQQLPTEHHPGWDEIARHSWNFAEAANAGASLGMAYHLFVDGLIQPAAYHHLGIELPLEVHSGIATANAVAEALDVGNKPSRKSKSAPSTAEGPAVDSDDSRAVALRHDVAVDRRLPDRSSSSVRDDSASPRPSPPARRSTAVGDVKPVEPQDEIVPGRLRLTAEVNRCSTSAADEMAHKEYRRRRFPLDDAVADRLSCEHKELLTNYGAWMKALATGVLRPTTDRQRRFVEAAQLRRPATSAHELAWASYVRLSMKPKPGPV